jgi:hypothetical protein
MDLPYAQVVSRGCHQICFLAFLVWNEHDPGHWVGVLH